jgi:hypothetical protein
MKLWGNLLLKFACPFHKDRGMRSTPHLHVSFSLFAYIQHCTCVVEEEIQVLEFLLMFKQVLLTFFHYWNYSNYINKFESCRGNHEILGVQKPVVCKQSTPRNQRLFAKNDPLGKSCEKWNWFWLWNSKNHAALLLIDEGEVMEIPMEFILICNKVCYISLFYKILNWFL